MAEIVGLTASIITLAGVGATLARTLRDATDAIRSADHEARLMAADISVFASSLVQLSKTLPMLSNVDIPEAGRLREIVEVLISACSSLVDELQKYIGEPISFRRKGPVWISAIRWHFRWLLQRPKITFIKTLIESFKSTLIFLLSTMDLALVIHQEAQDDIKENFKLQVETNLRFSADAKASLLQCQDSPPLLESFETPEPPANTSLNMVPALDYPSKSIVAFRKDNSIMENGVLACQNEHDEPLQVSCLKECPTDLVRILEVHTSTSEVAENLLKIRPTPRFSWGLPATGLGSQQSIPSKTSLHRNASRVQDSSQATSPPDSVSLQSSRGTSLHDTAEGFGNLDEMSQPANPLQFLDQDEPLTRNEYNDKEASDLQRLIRKIMEETLLAQKQDAYLNPDIGASDSASSKQRTTDASSTKDDRSNSFHTSLFTHPSPDKPSSYTSDTTRFMFSKDTEPSSTAADHDGDGRLTKLERIMLAERDEMIRQNALTAEKEISARIRDAVNSAREEARTRAEEEAAASRELHERALAEAKATAEELEKAKQAAEEEAAKLRPSDAPKAPIKFKDAVGRKFSFPWHICKTWKGMEELIKQAFLHVEVIGEHVHDGHYDLIGPDGQIVLPQIWETMVEPDWSVTMHMWPIPEPEPPPSVPLLEEELKTKGKKSRRL